MTMLNVPCRWCEDLTTNQGTRECDQCWNLRNQIEGREDLAASMVATLRAVKAPGTEEKVPPLSEFCVARHGMDSEAIANNLVANVIDLRAVDNETFWDTFEQSLGRLLRAVARDGLSDQAPAAFLGKDVDGQA